MIVPLKLFKSKPLLGLLSQSLKLLVVLVAEEPHSICLPQENGDELLTEAGDHDIVRDSQYLLASNPRSSATAIVKTFCMSVETYIIGDVKSSIDHEC